MRQRLRNLWPIVKVALGLLLLVFVCRRFHADLQRPELWQRPLRPTWLVLSALTYLAGLAFSSLYWRRLLVGLDERPGWLAPARAYYVGHLGKYLPGKAWALLLRVGLIRPAGVRTDIAVATTFYEVLTTMAGGSLLALGLYAVWAEPSAAPLSPGSLTRIVRLDVPEGGLNGVLLLALAGGLLLVTGLPLVPPVFNRLVRRLSLPFRDRSAPPPPIRVSWLVEGLLLTAIGWTFLGASLVAVLHGLHGAELAWTLAGLARVTAGLTIACVAGFVIVVAPAGLGVREYLLTLLLAPELELAAALTPDAARASAILAVLVLRLVWTVAELIMAGTLYWLR